MERGRKSSGIRGAERWGGGYVIFFSVNWVGPEAGALEFCYLFLFLLQLRNNLTLDSSISAWSYLLNAVN